MRRILDRFRYGTILPAALLASAVLGLAAAVGLILLPMIAGPTTEMRIEPSLGTLRTDTTFTVHIVVESSVPVNVFAGELHFDPNILSVQSIDYNTSIANLWAKEPWYENGAGIVGFAGGTTHAGGFWGTDTLLSITFHARAEGVSALTLRNARILEHDGLGTDAAIAEPIDALFTIQNASSTDAANLMSESTPGGSLHVVASLPSTDLNGDGKHTLADVSIFMLHMASENPRYDFNQDGRVTIRDLGILLSAH